MSGDLRGISQQSISLIIKNVFEQIAQHLPHYITLPRQQQQQMRNRRMFQAVAGFPGITGCIDCTHIKIASPGGKWSIQEQKRFFLIKCASEYCIVKSELFSNFLIIETGCSWPTDGNNWHCCEASRVGTWQLNFWPQFAQGPMWARSIERIIAWG